MFSLSLGVKKTLKIDVLGTEYTVTFSNEGNDEKLVGKDGYCDTSVKECVIDEMNDTSINEKKNLKEYQKSVTRHELIHAFLYESGLETCSTWAGNEEMVDWFAIQFPKLLKAFKDADCI